MVQFLLASFFLLALAGAIATLHLTMREYWEDIVAAFLGEMPRARPVPQAWSRSRPMPRRRPMAVIAVRRSAAA